MSNQTAKKLNQITQSEDIVKAHRLKSIRAELKELAKEEKALKTYFLDTALDGVDNAILGDVILIKKEVSRNTLQKSELEKVYGQDTIAKFCKASSYFKVEVA